MVHQVDVTVLVKRPAKDRAADALMKARRAYRNASWAHCEGDHVEAIGHEQEVLCQLSRLEDILAELTQDL